MRLLRVVVAVSLTALAAAALAKPEFQATFNAAYKVKPNSAIAKLGCNLCHTPALKLNPYGADIKKAMRKSKAPTAATFKMIESLDSDKDRIKNGVEIKAGTNPGDATSKPVAAPRKAGKG
jgi:hypothetical protein